MSFVVWAALAVGALAVVPFLAHLLRRGRVREHEFPPTAFVPISPATSRERRRLEDRALLIRDFPADFGGPLLSDDRRRRQQRHAQRQTERPSTHMPLLGKIRRSFFERANIRAKRRPG